MSLVVRQVWADAPIEDKQSASSGSHLAVFLV
jgi:hypothetical protein